MSRPHASRIRTVALPCALLLAALLAATLLLEVASSAPAAQAQEDGPAEQLAAKHAPVVYLKQQGAPCDPHGEAYYPVAVEIVLGNPQVAFYDGASLDPVVPEAPTAADLYEQDEDYYLDFPGDPEKPRCVYEETFKAITPAPDPVVYARITQEEGFDGQLVLQYWLYFYFNDWNNNHESDWEFIQLVFDADDAEGALATSPDTMIYSQHGGGETSSWDDSKVRKEGDRPVIYVAKGSHAIQYRDETFLGKGADGTGFGCDDASGPSFRVDPEARLIPDEITGPDDPFAWITYEGRWGEKTHGEFNGPTGPNTKKPWSLPLTWQELQRDSSIKVPEESIGPNAADAFCGMVAAGSRLLFGLGPGITVALALGLVGGLGVTVARTRFRPVEPAPLRKRRHFGQILRTAFRVERAHWRLFLGIGALFVPVGLVTGVVQAIILMFTPAEPLLDVMDEPIISAVAALSIGAAQFGLTYWVVLTATIASLGEVDAGRPTSILDSYRLMWRGVGPLLRARLRSLAVVAGLSLTIVGIPWAIWYGVRWLFIEQTILLDRHDHRDALPESARIVSGDWWRTFGASAAMVLTGIALGPAIGVVLVLLTSTSLILVNVLSSVMYLVLIPFVGIGLTLLYFDLKLANGDHS